MGQFDDMIETAQELIEENGQLVQWRSFDDVDSIDLLQPWRPGDASYTDTDVYICFLSVNKESYESLAYFTDKTLLIGSVLGLMGAVNFELSLKSIVIRDGKELRIKSIDTLAPNGQNILHTIIFAK